MKTKHPYYRIIIIASNDTFTIIFAYLSLQRVFFYCFLTTSIVYYIIIEETLHKYFELNLMNFSSKYGDFSKRRIGIRIEEKDEFGRKRRKNSRMVGKPIYARSVSLF